MGTHWTRIERRIAELGCEADMGLRAGAATDQIAALERHLGVELPQTLRDFYEVHDGQDGFGLALGQQLLPLSEIRRHWDAWRSIEKSAGHVDWTRSMDSYPAGFIKPMYSNPGWIPLTSDAAGNHIGLDMDPGPLGAVGQVIAFGRDESTKRVLASSFDEFQLKLAAWLDRAQ